MKNQKKEFNFSKEAVFPDGEIKSLSLDDEMFKGKKIVLYFYPWNGTPGCTLQGKIFNEHLDELGKQNIAVIGVNNGSLTSHKKFIGNLCLKFPIISDKSKTIAKLFGVNGFLSRKTVLLDEHRNVVKIFHKVDIKNQIEDIREGFNLSSY